MRRRTELTRCARQLLTPPALTNGLDSALEDIEKRSLELLEKATAARFAGKAGGSERVAGLIEQLRGAVTNYQVSENYLIASSTTYAGRQISHQEAIYDRITNLTVRICWFISPPHADDRLLYQVVFRCALEASRGNPARRAHHGTD